MNLSEEVIRKLIEMDLSISVCESASGGALASTIVEIAGVSKVFRGGFITYSNDAKIRIAKVRESTIERHGAISEHVAREMSENTNRLFKSDICISITGNAGPTAHEDKPIGEYYIGVTLINKTFVQKVTLDNSNRTYNRFNVAWHALKILGELLDVKIAK